MPSRAHALLVPDEEHAGTLRWLPVPGEQVPVGTEEWQSAVQSWQANFQAAQDAGSIAWWNGAGGPWVIDGLTSSFGGQWHLNVGDADQDGLPDDIDPYPQDATNHSFYWTGGTFTINGIKHTFRADSYAGVPDDANQNNIPDVLEDWFTNPSAHGTLQHWDGGTFLINGEYSTFEGFSYFADSQIDSDGDGIPDQFDPYPSDVWNNTFFIWNGTRYSGVFVDTDGDGIPDVADAYPNDPTNTDTTSGPSNVFDPNADDDGDGIPNGVEVQYPGVLDPHNSADAGYTRADGLTYLQAYQQGLPLVIDAESSNSDGSTSNETSTTDPNNDSDGDGLPDGVEAQYPGLLDASVNDSGTDRGDGLTYLQAYQYGLVLNNLDNDGDGMSDAWEIANGLNSLDPNDAAQSANNDGVFNLEKYKLGVAVTDSVTAEQVAGLYGTGDSSGGGSTDEGTSSDNENTSSTENDGLTDDPNLSAAENDWDGDGISNRDEIMIFGTDPRDNNSSPSREDLEQAFANNELSASTLVNYSQEGDNVGMSEADQEAAFEAWLAGVDVDSLVNDTDFDDSDFNYDDDVSSSNDSQGDDTDTTEASSESDSSEDGQAPVDVAGPWVSDGLEAEGSPVTIGTKTITKEYSPWTSMTIGSHNVGPVFTVTKTYTLKAVNAHENFHRTITHSDGTQSTETKQGPSTRYPMMPEYSTSLGFSLWR